MININGTCVTALFKLDTLHQSTFLTGLHFYEEMRYEDDLFLFFELHYFRIMAALRRLRFKIPVSFTIDYFKNELVKTLKSNSMHKKSAIIRIHFFFNSIYDTKKTEFIIESESANSIKKINVRSQYVIDIYSENFILKGEFSNLTHTNRGIRHLVNSYAFENGMDDCIVLNNEKKIVETTNGTLYLLKNNKLITPDLISGCQNTAIRSCFNNWIEKEEKNIFLEKRSVNSYELQKSEELFILSIKHGMINISNYRKTSYQIKESKKLYLNFLSSI
jgi:branched-chain amino acid aminotransferase